MSSGPVYDKRVVTLSSKQNCSICPRKIEAGTRAFRLRRATGAEFRHVRCHMGTVAPEAKEEA